MIRLYDIVYPIMSDIENGALFKTVVDDKQYYVWKIAVDEYALGSDIVAVYDVDPIQLPKSEYVKKMLFYVHTYVDLGVKDKTLVKYGSLDPKLNLKKIIFKDYMEGDLAEDVTDGKYKKDIYMVWNSATFKARPVPYKKGLKVLARDGGVVSIENVVYEIRHGKSRFLNE